MIGTAIGIPISERTVSNYFEKLVNRFFKILPIREGGEKTLPVYIKSLQSELVGCGHVINGFSDNPDVLTLISMLQFMLDNPDAPVADVKREVFRAIAICNRLRDEFEGEEVMSDGRMGNLSE